MANLADLRPCRKELVFDLVEQAGFDVSDWIASASSVRSRKANPKYCYSWSFVEPGIAIILNLWFDRLEEEDGLIIQSNNFRADASNIQGAGGRPVWVRRSTQADEALQVALRTGLAVRVIINDGVKRNFGKPHGEPSIVTARQLDPSPWTITKYDWNTGKHTISRGAPNRVFVDQFDVGLADNSAKLEQRGYAFVRDPKVRAAALARGNGKCELCGDAGFEMPTGAIYLETHHIVPLCEGGRDDISNVAALCPNDHRKAHYGLHVTSIQKHLLAKIACANRTNAWSRDVQTTGGGSRSPSRVKALAA